MVSKRLIVGGLAAVAAAAAVAVVVFAQKPGGGPSPQLGSITLVASSTAISAGQAVGFTGVVKDTAGNPMSGVRGSLLESGSSIGSFTTDSTGSFSLSVTFATAGTFSIAAASGSISSPPVTINVSGGPPPPPVLTSLSVAPSATTVAAGGSVTIVVTAKDQNGVGIPSVSGQLTEGGSAVGPFSTGAGGTASVVLAFPSAGTYLVGAVSGAVSATPVTITVTAPPVLTTLTLTPLSPVSITPGGSVTFAILAKDQSGLGVQVSGQMTEGGSPVAGSNFVTASDGTASVSLQFPSAGTYVVGAVSGSVSSNTVSVAVAAPPPPSQAFTVQTASGNPTGANTTILSNLSTVSGPQQIHYEAWQGTFLVASRVDQRGWNAGELLTDSATWPTIPLPPGSYMLKVYVTDTSGTTVESNVFTQAFTA